MLPVYDDHRASFSVNAESGLWFCHACNQGETARIFAERMKVEPPADHNLTAEYVFDYRDEDSKLLYQVVASRERI